MSEYLARDAYRERLLEHGGIIRPWIAAGPFFRDVSNEVAGRSLFEDLDSRAGEVVFRVYVAEAEALLAYAPTEGDTLTYAGDTAEYVLVENEEPFVNWGAYFVGNRVVTQFIATNVRVAVATTVRFRLRTRIDPQVAIAVNGRLQYRSYETGYVRTNQSWEGEHSAEFDLELRCGINTLTLAALRMGRIACGAICLEVVDESVWVSAPLSPEPDQTDRATLEATRDLFHPAREWFYPHERVRLLRQPDLDHVDGDVTCELIAEGRTRKTVVASTDQHEVDLGEAGDAGGFTFELRTTVVAADRRLEPRSFACTCVDRTPTAVDARYEERCRIVLEHFASRDDAWAQVARYTLGRADGIDPAVIEDGCRYIDRRLDCADFILHPQLRLLRMDRDADRIAPELVERMTITALGFRYWTSEPGQDSLVTGTENHQILFHTAEIIAGHLWPDEVFPNSGMTGREHVAHGRELAVAWLQQRLATGFEEWHSSSYYPHWIAALVDLCDSVTDEEAELTGLARAVLTMGFLNIAADSFEGALLTTHGRVYAPMLKAPDLDGCSGIHWLLFGDGNLTEPTAVVPLAAGSVRPPQLLDSIALATDEVRLTRHRNADARFIVYRTPDFMMSALQDYHPGERAAQVHPFQITFRDKVCVFFSCPQTSNEGGGFRPDYWSGNGSLPRVFGERNVAVLLFRVGTAGWMSHCYFERDRFAEVVERDGWVFARKADGYLAIWSENGHETAVRGRYARRELICRAESNAWIVQAGRRVEWGGFSRFVDAVARTGPDVNAGVLRYASPGVGEIRMGWDGPILLDGTPVSFDYPLLDGPYAHSAYGSGSVTIRYGDHGAHDVPCSD